jgi:hypothetical protein
MKKVIGVAAHQRAGQPDQPARTAVEHTKVVALGGLLRQLMQFVSDRIVPPAVHVPADVRERRHALDLRAICLPERREHGRPLLLSEYRLRMLHCIEVHARQIAAIRRLDCSSRVGMITAPLSRPDSATSQTCFQW